MASSIEQLGTFVIHWTYSVVAQYIEDVPQQN